MTKGEDFIKNAKCTHGNRAAMSNSAWCDLNKKCTVLKLKICAIILIVYAKNKSLLLQSNTCFKAMSLKIQRIKIFKGSQAAWKKNLKPAVNVAAPFIGIAVGAKTKNPKVAQATTIISKSISAGKILSLTDMHGYGLRLRVM